MKPLCACILLASLGCATLRGPGDRPLRIDWVFTERPSAEAETRAAQRELASRGLEIAKSREEADLVADVEDTGDGLFLRLVFRPFQAPQHFLNFLPEPQVQGSFLPTLFALRSGSGGFKARSRSLVSSFLSGSTPAMSTMPCS